MFKQCCNHLNKLRAFFLLAMAVCCIPVLAQSAGNDPLVSMNKKDIPLKEIFSEISRQTSFYFMGSNDQINENEHYSIKVEKEPLLKVLNKLFDSRNINWKIQDRVIMLTRKNMSSGNRNFNEAVERMDTNILITGRVISEKGEPIPGVTIKVKNSNVGTTTDNAGFFNLKDITKGTILVLSSVSFVTRELVVSGNQEIEIIQLKPFIGELDAAIVIGYGTAKKRTSTASVAVVNSKEIQQQPINDPLLSLVARVPGLIVTPTSGNFGAPVNLQIRGQNSLNFSSNPLFIVDDVPIDNQNFSLVNNITGSLSPFSFINPNDIESISILKDADATAIYGSRGANGVVLITTKKGKMGRTDINLNAQVGFGKVPKKLKLLNTSQYLSMRKEAYENDGIDYTVGGVSSANTDLRLFDQTRYTDWQDVIIGNSAQYQDYQGSISGGNHNVQYTIGGNFHYETTVYPGSNNNKKGNVHFSIGGNSTNDRLSITFTGSYLVDNMNTGGSDYTSDIFFAPNAPDLLNLDGTINWAINPATGISAWTFLGNPYARNEVRNKVSVNNLISTLRVNYEIVDNLNFKIVAGYNRINGSNSNTEPITSVQPFLRAISSPPFLRNAVFSNSIAESYSVEPQLTYSFEKMENKFDFLLGSSLQNNVNQSDVLRLSGFSSDALLLNRNAATMVTDKGNTSSDYKYNALFARITYNRDNKYIINLNGRRDGSSRFGPGHQFGNFGSIGAAWVFSEEKFIIDHLKKLSFGKLRMSYGLSGNDGIGNYAYLESYRLSNNTVTYQNDLGYTSNGTVNGNYHWETVKKLEFGLELGVLKNRLLIESNYFRNRSDNQLINYPIPSLAGYGNVYVNLPAKLQNTGIEMSLNTTNIHSKKFTWKSSFNITANRNKLLNYPNIDSTAYYLTQIGQPFYGYVNVYKFAGVDPSTGKYQFYNDKGELTDNPSSSNPPFYGQIGRVITYPKYYGGFSNSFTYKNISLDVLLQFVKQKGINTLYQAGPTVAGPGTSRLNLLEDVYNKRWHGNNSGDGVMKLSTGFGNLTSLSSVRASDAGYTDASFVRLKNISFSYNFVGKWLQKSKIQQCRIYLQGQNLITFTKYKGFDPETQSLTSLPPLRIMTAGIQLNM